MFVANFLFMFDSTAYSNDFSKSIILVKKLRERVFLKTEMDVVYTHFSNWERHGLLYRCDDNKGKWKTLNYVEYTWVKIVERLADFGFSYDYIRKMKSNFFIEVDVVELKKIVRDNMDYVMGKGVDDEMVQLVEFSDEDLRSVDIKLFGLEMFLLNVIFHHETYSLFFFPDRDDLFLPVSAEMMKIYALKQADDSINKLLSESYVSISLSGIISKFLIDGDGAFEDRATTVLTKEEHALLKVVRNKPKELKSIKIRYKNQAADLIEVSSLKKVKLESRLMDCIKKGEYLNIEIVTDGKGILKYENTKKIKV